MGRLFALCLVLVLTSACRNDVSGVAPSAESGRLVMKTYPLPAESAEDIRRAIAELLYPSGEHDQSLGGARLVGGSSLVVLAPEQLQPSVERTIEALVVAAKASRNQPVEASGSKVYTVHFWIVQEAAGTEGGSALPPSIAASEAAIRSQFGVGPLKSVSSMAVSVSDVGGAKARGAMTLFVELKKGSLQRLPELVVEVGTADFGVNAQLPLTLDTPIVLSQLGARTGGDGAFKPRFVILLVRDATAAG